MVRFSWKWLVLMISKTNSNLAMLAQSTEQSKTLRIKWKPHYWHWVMKGQKNKSIENLENIQEVKLGAQSLTLLRMFFLFIFRLNLNLGHIGSKTRSLIHISKKKSLVSTLEVTFLTQSLWYLVRMFVLVISLMNLKLDHVMQGNQLI